MGLWERVCACYWILKGFGTRVKDCQALPHNSLVFLPQWGLRSALHGSDLCLCSSFPTLFLFLTLPTEPLV